MTSSSTLPTSHQVEFPSTERGPRIQETDIPTPAAKAVETIKSTEIPTNNEDGRVIKGIPIAALESILRNGLAAHLGVTKGFERPSMLLCLLELGEVALNDATISQRLGVDFKACGGILKKIRARADWRPRFDSLVLKAIRAVLVDGKPYANEVARARDPLTSLVVVFPSAYLVEWLNQQLHAHATGVDVPEGARHKAKPRKGTNEHLVPDDTVRFIKTWTPEVLR